MPQRSHISPSAFTLDPGGTGIFTCFALSPVSADSHAAPDNVLQFWLGAYVIHHPELECYSNATLLLKRYDDMPKLCNATAERYKNKPEELIVLGMLYASYLRAERPELATRTLARMEETFAAMPATAFSGGMEEFTKAYWQKWFDQVKRR